jgi:hypothetical protein
MLAGKVQIDFMVRPKRFKRPAIQKTKEARAIHSAIAAKWLYC